MNDIMQAVKVLIEYCDKNKCDNCPLYANNPRYKKCSINEPYAWDVFFVDQESDDDMELSTRKA